MYMSYEDVKNKKEQVIEIIKTQLRNNSSYEDGTYWFHFFVAEDFDGDDEYGNNTKSLVVVGEFSDYDNSGKYIGDRHTIVHTTDLECTDYMKEYAEILGVEYVLFEDWDFNEDDWEFDNRYMDYYDKKEEAYNDFFSKSLDEIYSHVFELYENHPDFTERFQDNCEAIYNKLLRDLEEVS